MVAVVALYHFAPVADPVALQAEMALTCARAEARGTLLVAEEGVNGTLAGPRAGLEGVLAALRAKPGFAPLNAKWSEAAEMPFAKLKVRQKAEIVTMGQPGIDPTRAAGQYVEPGDWNALISAPDVAVIDTRNAFEVAIGSFRGAIDPGTESFRDFPAWWQANKAQFAGKKVAMFCTGGIRCEKSTAFLRSQGVEEVFHLKGGILKYLEDVPEAESLWDGACFVFDERVAVDHHLQETDHLLCRACRRALAPADCARPEFEAGVSCHYCLEEHSDADRDRFRERQKQMALARARGERHLG